MSDLEKYTESFRSIGNTASLEYVLFSDTIVISTTDESESSLLKLMQSCSRLFGGLLLKEISLRGAIARGSFIREKTDTGVFLAGRPVIDAYRFEKQQDWVGVMLTPSVLETTPKLRSRCQISRNSTHGDWMRCVQPCSSIPFHHDDSLVGVEAYEGFAIVPTDSDACDKEETLTDFRRMIQSLARLKSLAPNPRAQEKYKKTSHWLEHLVVQWTSTW